MKKKILTTILLSLLLMSCGPQKASEEAELKMQATIDAQVLIYEHEIRTITEFYDLIKNLRYETNPQLQRYYEKRLEEYNLGIDINFWNVDEQLKKYKQLIDAKLKEKALYELYENSK